MNKFNKKILKKTMIITSLLILMCGWTKSSVDAISTNNTLLETILLKQNRTKNKDGTGTFDLIEPELGPNFDVGDVELGEVIPEETEELEDQNDGNTIPLNEDEDVLLEDIGGTDALSYAVGPEWTELEYQEWARIKLSDDLDLYYGFGPGTWGTYSGDYIENTGIKMQGYDYPQYIIPNAILYDKKAPVQDREIKHLFKSEDDLYTSMGIFATFGNSATDKSMFGLKLDKGTEGYKYYKKMVGTRTFYKIVYESRQEWNGKQFDIAVDITMSALENNSVYVETKMTNIGKKSISNFTIGFSGDTMLGSDDHVPIRAIGNNEGVYIIDATGKYRLDYQFNVDYGPANWVGSKYASDVPTFFNKLTPTVANVPVDNHSLEPFYSLNSLGQESLNLAKDTQITNAGYDDETDTGINFKTQPIKTFAVGESADMNYVIGLKANKELPEITLDQQNGPYMGGDYTLSGKWLDKDSQSVELFYKIDDGAPVSMGVKTQTTAQLGKQHDYSYAILESVLEGLPSAETHTITVYAQDSDGKSNTPSVTLTFGKLDFVSAPTSLSFGTNLAIPIVDKTYPVATKTGDSLVVKDTRASGGTWRMKAQLLSELKSTTTNHTLPNVLFYKKDANTELALSTSVSTLIHSQTTANGDAVDLASGWSKDLGLVLKIKAASPPKAEEYKASIQWTLEDVPSNEEGG